VFGVEEYSVERWQQFQTVDLYDEWCQWIRTGRLDVATSLCGRFADIVCVKVVACLDATLAMVPDQVEVNDLCVWLTQDIVPPVLASQDTALIDKLAAWVEKRATDMEVTSGWPMNAIQLCDILWTDVCGSVPKSMTVKEYASRIVGLAVPQTSADEARQSTNALVRLRALHNDLRRITELRDKYNCSLSLAELCSETVQSVAYRLLDRVTAAELIPVAISYAVSPYATQNSLNLDELLTFYLEELAYRRGSGGVRVSAVWESKAMEILRHISSRELSERALMVVLGSAQFPWTEDVSNAVKSALERNPAHEGLQTQCQWASIRERLIRYDLHTFNFAGMPHAEDLAYYILTQDRDTAVEDAVAVTAVYSNVSPVDVYLFRCGFLAERDRAEENVSLLRGVEPPSVRDDVCERFVCYCEKVVSDPQSSCRRKFADAARHLQRLLSTLSSHCSQALRSQLSDLDAVNTLDSKFGKFMTVGDFGATSKRKERCDQWQEEFFDEALHGASLKPVGRNTMTVRSAAASNCSEKRPRKGDVRQLACLLKLSPHGEVFEAVHAARNGNVGTAVELLEHIVDQKMGNDVEMVGHVLMISVAVCESIKAGSEVDVSQLRVLHRASCTLALSAPADMLNQFLCVSRFFRLAVELASQCATDDGPLSPQRHGAADPYTQWTFDEYLSDEDCNGLLMDMKSALPPALATVAAAATPGILQPSEAAAAAIVESVGRVTQMLTANNQTRLFLSYSLQLASLQAELSNVDQVNAAVLTTLKQCVSRRRADHKLALAAALSFPLTLAHDNLQRLARSAGFQYKKAVAIAHVGQAVAQLNRDAAGLSVTRRFLMERRWGYRLAKVHVSFHEYLGRAPVDKRSLIPTLAAAESVSVADVVEYCSDFTKDVSDGLSLYLTCLLLPSPDSTSVVPSMPWPAIQQRAEQACRHIGPEQAVKTLQEVFAKTSPYDYERLEFILDQLLLLAESAADQEWCSLEPSMIERDRRLLDCLKSYRRVSPPTEEELVYGEDMVRTRLPFHRLRIKEQNWPIITAELNADTVPRWIAIAKILRLLADNIYATAVRNIVRSHTAELPSSQALWSDTSIDTKFIDTIQGLLSQVCDIVKC